MTDKELEAVLDETGDCPKCGHAIVLHKVAKTPCMAVDCYCRETRFTLKEHALSLAIDALKACEKAHGELVEQCDGYEDWLRIKQGKLEACQRELTSHGLHTPDCPQYTGPYDLGELEPPCACGAALEEGQE